MITITDASLTIPFLLMLAPPHVVRTRAEQQQQAKDRSQARHDRIDAMMGVNLAPMSDTQRYDAMRVKVRSGWDGGGEGVQGGRWWASTLRP